MHRHRSNCFAKTLGIIRLPPSSTSFILLLLINLASSEVPTVSDDLVERVNCRRVVFHPYCRGISAKRSLQQLQNGNTKPTVNTKTNSVEEFKPLNEWESIWNTMTEAQNLQRSAIEQQHQIIRSMLPRFISVGDVGKDHQNEEYQLIDADHTGDQRRDQQRHQLPPYLLNIPSIMIETGNSRQARQQRLFPFPQHFQLPPLQHQII